MSTSRTSGWWAVDPETSSMGDGTTTGLVSGDGPADIMDEALCSIINLYEDNLGRRPYQEEIKAVWNFTANPKVLADPASSKYMPPFQKVALRHLLKIGELQAAEALYGFMGWLTSNDQAEGPFGGSHDAARAADLVDAFCRSQGLAEPRDDFAERLQIYPPNERVAFRWMSHKAMEITKGPGAETKTWQADFPLTVPCCHCSGTAELAFTAFEGQGEDQYLCNLKKTTGQAGGLWLHDAAAVAVYFCRECLEVTAQYNQA